MKKIIIGIIISSCLCFLVWHIGYKEGIKDCKREFVAEEVEQVVSDTFQTDSDSEYDEWTTMILALLRVESENNIYSISPNGATGVLQLTPSYVEDANRIMGWQAFTLDDRWDIEKSVQMFAAVQGYYNPKHDIEKAIKLHNPDGGKIYMYKVKSAMYDIASNLYLKKIKSKENENQG